MHISFDWLADFKDENEFKESNVKNDIEENMFVKHSFLSGHSRTKIFAYAMGSALWLGHLNHMRHG